MGTVCGLRGALSVTTSFAVTFPKSSGMNVTTMLQLAPGATEPQLLLTLKSSLSAPEIGLTEILVMLNVAFPVLVTVSV